MPKQLLAWNEARHSTGIASIDNQHKEMVRLVNELEDAIRQGCGHEETKRRLGEIIAFIGGHFAHEEQLMQEHGFPELESHRAEHARLLEGVTNLMNAHKTSHPAKAAITAAYLTDWAEEHILHADRRIGEFLAARGVK
jgi:hemerythrin